MKRVTIHMRTGQNYEVVMTAAEAVTLTADLVSGNFTWWGKFQLALSPGTAVLNLEAAVGVRIEDEPAAA